MRGDARGDVRERCGDARERYGEAREGAERTRGYAGGYGRVRRCTGRRAERCGEGAGRYGEVRGRAGECGRGCGGVRERVRNVIDTPFMSILRSHASRGQAGEAGIRLPPGRSEANARGGVVEGRRGPRSRGRKPPPAAWAALAAFPCPE